MLATSQDAHKYHCPFLDRPCMGDACFCWRQSSLKTSRGPLGYCGVAGERWAGAKIRDRAWKEPATPHRAWKEPATPPNDNPDII